MGGRREDGEGHRRTSEGKAPKRRITPYRGKHRPNEPCWRDGRGAILDGTRPDSIIYNCSRATFEGGTASHNRLSGCRPDRDRTLKSKGIQA